MHTVRPGWCLRETRSRPCVRGALDRICAFHLREQREHHHREPVLAQASLEVKPPKSLKAHRTNRPAGFYDSGPITEEGGVPIIGTLHRFL